MSPARRSQLIKTILTILPAVAFVLFCLWFGQRQQHATESHSTAGAQQQATQSVLGGVPSPHTGQAGDGGQQNQSDADKWSDPIVLLTFLLVVLTSVIAAIYYGQLRQMRKTVAFMV